MRVKVAEIRKQLGVSQGELADRVGFSRPYLAQIESEKRNLSAVNQAKIAEALGVNASSLVDFEAPNQGEEEFLIEAFRLMEPRQRKEWLNLARVITGESEEPE